MRKRYLFLLTLLFPLATMFTSGTARAADPDKSLYEAALAAFPSGKYYITTEVDGVKYYVTASGTLEERTEYTEDSEGLFTFNQVDGGAYATIGWHIEGANGHFSNTELSNNLAYLHRNLNADGTPKSDSQNFRLDTGNNRNDWESQVFFLNEEGKVAIRSCNTAFGESSWADAGRAFWTYEVDEVGDPIYGDYGLVPGYTYEAAFIWTLERPAGDFLLYEVVYGVFSKYEDQYWDNREAPISLNMGTEYGQYRDYESWYALWDLLQEVNEILMSFDEYTHEWISEDEKPTLEALQDMAEKADNLYQAVINSEKPFSIPGDGYYRVKSILRYYNDVVIGTTTDENGDEVDETERNYLDKVMLASFANKGMFGTLREDMANQVWYLEQKGDSILMKNVGMNSFISTSKTPGTEGRIFLTEDENDAACVVFDWAGPDYLEDGDGTAMETFNIRLNSKARHAGNYVHQNGHNRGKDSGNDLELSFWNSTYGKGKYEQNDGGTSEWYLEPVTQDEVDAMIENFEILKNHDLLVTKNNELRQKVAETLEFAKDIKRTALITSTSQLSSPNSDEAEGTNLGNLIDGNTGTFWHTSWHSSNQEPRVLYNDVEYHYLQMSGMNAMKGNCEFYFAQRNGASYDHPSKVVLLGSDDEEKADEEWEVIAELTIPNVAYAAENTVPFTVEIDEETYPEGYSFVRVIVTEVKTNEGASMEHRTYWHASEIQIYTVEENPNSQYVLYYDDASNLETIYEENLLIADDDLKPEDYNKLLEAYEVFLGNLVDPAEMRAALTQYAKATEGVVKGTNPGQFTDDKVAKDYEDLYAEVDAYNKDGRYKAEQIHKYAVMLKAMSKSIMEQANGVETDKWYRIMFPTEEMYDAYGWAKDGGDKTSLRDDDEYQQGTMWGTFATAAKLESEEVQDVDEYGDPKYDDEGNEVMKTNYWLEALGGEDLRESNAVFFMNEDEIEDKDASMFRFVQLETEGEEPDYATLFGDVKANIGLAIDLNVTKRGDALITDAAQFSSNASYPGNDGQKLESGCLIDGNTATYWHSDYSKTYNAVPYLQVALNEPVSGFIQVYVARRNTNNGHVIRMYVQGSNDAETWTNVGYIETPYTNATTPVYSQPIDLGGTFSHLRFTMTQRSGTDGGSYIEFDPFAEGLTADDYNTKFTYFHASEFQVYPVTVKAETEKAQALQETFATVNKVLLKDVTAEDFNAAVNVYKDYQTEFNASQFKTILPNGSYETPVTYALQNKATGLYISFNGTGNQSYGYLKTIPTLFTYKAPGYERSLLAARNVAGTSCNYLHAGENVRRICTWSSTEPNTNSGLVICEADEEYAAPTEFTFLKDVKPGRIADWCHSITLNQVEAPDDAHAYTAVGQYTVGEDENAEMFLALKAVETIPAGEPALFIYGDTLSYDPEVDDDLEPVKFQFAADEKPVFEGKTVNGLVGTLVPYTLDKYQMYFNANYVTGLAEGQSVSVTPCSAVLDLDKCPVVEAEPTLYDFSVSLGQSGKDVADGVKDISSAIEKISQPGNVYSMDGKLLRTGATLNSLKALGTGTYILNGVKVVVK